MKEQAMTPANHSRKLTFFRLAAENMFNRTVMLTALLLCCMAWINAQPPSHDPSRMIRNVDGRYWIFTTGQGIWCMSSSNSNFTDWRAENTPFGNSWPSWIANYVSGFTGFFWAPDIISMNGKYYLYYSCAGTGAPAAIGVTTATNLLGPWSDQGVVQHGNNAIDPALLQDGGNLWMTWGNWQSGIDICRLSTSTGKRLNSTTYHLVDGQVEGPFLIHNGSYYYLFYQRGLCCQGVNSTYYVVVARSTSVTGPYSGERVFLPNRNGNIIGPGHVGYGEGKLTYHYYDGNDNGNPKLMITTLGWSNGWPVAGGTSSGGSSGGSGITSGGTYRITPRNSGKAIDVENCGTGNGTNVRQWSWLNNSCQQFIMTDNGDGTWRITPSNATGEALDLTNCSSSNGANIEIWSWLNNSCQRWQLVNMGSGYYQIKSAASGQCVNIYGNSSSDGANVIQWPCSSAYNMEFSFTQTKSAEETIIPYESVEEASSHVYPNPSDGNFVLDLSGINAKSNITIRIMDLTGKVVYSKSQTMSKEIDISSGLVPGSYVLSVEHANGVLMNKLVIK